MFLIAPSNVGTNRILTRFQTPVFRKTIHIKPVECESSLKPVNQVIFFIEYPLKRAEKNDENSILSVLENTKQNIT